MKKILVTLLSVVLAVTLFATMAFAADVSVKLDGKTLSFEQPPVIIEGRTLVPLRAIFEALGASVEWDGDTKTVTSVKGDVTVKLTIGSNVLYKNAETVELDVPAQIVGEGYTMVPARAIAESYGVTVNWDDATKTVLLTSPAAIEPTTPVAPAVDGAVVPLLEAEKYDGNQRFYASGTASSVLKVVDDPNGEKGKVFFLESNVTDRDSWTYFRASDAYFKNNQKYIVEFDIMLHDVDSHGNTASECGFGISYRYFNTVEEKLKDHSAAHIAIEPGEWVHVTLVKALNPNEPADETQPGMFGIYASPVQTHCYSYYLDNISVLPYDGNLVEGMYDAAAIAEAKKNAEFDIDTIEGLVYDFESGDFLGCIASEDFAPVVADGALNLTCTEETGADVLFDLPVNFAAADYNKLAIKFKCDNEDEFLKSLVCVYFATDSDPKINGAKNAQCPIGSSNKLDDGYYVAILNLGANESWNGQITAMRIDPMHGPLATVSIDKFVIFKD